MNANDREGGAAFPTNAEGGAGMSMLDYFAGQALIGLISNIHRPGPDAAEFAAGQAYTFAEAMVKEAKKLAQGTA